MRPHLLFACAFVVALAACGDDDGTTPDDGGTTDTATGDTSMPDTGPRPDAGPQTCTIADTECPADQPFSSAACDLADSCTYPDPDGTTTWTYVCTDGLWMGTNDCMPPPGGVCPVGPLAEGCRTPFEGSMPATVEIGPPGAGAFRPFRDGEPIELIVGGQGAPMIAFRVRVAGEDVPACVSMSTVLTADAGEPQPVSMRPLVLHCGESLSMFEIVGGDFCRPGPFTLDVHVTLAGIGESTATVTFGEVPCTG